MAKTLKEAPLTTVTARAGLKAGVHWRRLDASTHLGYRRGTRGGVWLVRWRDGQGYSQAKLANADDFLPADGRDVLSFDMAERAAKARLVEIKAAAVQAAKAAADAALGPPLTVAVAMREYEAQVEKRRERSGKGSVGDLGARRRRHVDDDFIGTIELSKLQPEDLAAWRDRLRAKGLAETSVTRTRNDLRAALNLAALAHRRRLPADFALALKAGFARGVDEPVNVGGTRPNVILPDADVRALIEAAKVVDERDGWEGDLHRAVVALAATGARFSQVARCTVADLQADRLMVPSSAKGRARDASKKVAVPLGADVVRLLRVAVAGRRGHEILLVRWGYARNPDNRKLWVKDRRRPWEHAELSAPFREIVIEVGLSADVTAYALRHSSIVRALRAGLPIRLVASLHDTSSDMIEKHYSAFIADALGDLAAKAIVPLVEAPAGVVPITSAKSAR